MLHIVKKGKAQFSIFDKKHITGAVDLDFSPFLNQLDKKTGILFHLRAKPPQNPSCWTYGFYDVAKDEYYSANSFEIFAFCKNLECLTNTFKPSHLMYYPNATLNITDGHAIILEKEKKEKA